MKVNVRIRLGGVGLGLAVMLMLISNLTSAAAPDIVDHISGQVAGGSSVTVQLFAWGAHGPQNLVQLVPVARVTPNGGSFDFKVRRADGEQATSRAGISFRGWGVAVEGATCASYQMRGDAQVLGDACHIGWLIRPWDNQPLDAQNAVVFHVAATTNQSGGSNVGANATPAGQLAPPSPVPAAPTLAPPQVAPPSPTLVTTPALPSPTSTATALPLPATPDVLIVDDPTSTQAVQPTTPEQPTDPPLPSITPLASATPTQVPIIIEQHTNLNITPQPTSANPQPTPTQMIIAQAANTSPTAVPAAGQEQSSGFDLLAFIFGNWPIIIGVVIAGLLIIALVAFLLRRGNRATNYSANITIADGYDNTDGAAANGYAPTSVVNSTGGNYDGGYGAGAAPIPGYDGYGQPNSLGYGAGYLNEDEEPLPEYISGVDSSSSLPRRYDPNAPTTATPAPGYEPYSEGELN